MKNIRIQNLSFAYKDEPEKKILENLSLEVESGEFVCILGQSGCGKSTLLRLLAGLEKQTEGEMTLDGTPISGASLDRSVVFQDYGLFPWMTAGENITLALEQKYPKKTKEERISIAKETLKKVGLPEEVFRKLPRDLSGGMKQRCAIARSLSVNPPILLMDEPFGALDAVTRARLQDLVLQLWQEEEVKKTVFFVTHDVDEALLLSTRIIVLGQRPSKIIYDERIPDEKRGNRDTMFEDPEILKRRAELVRTINKDVASRVEYTDFKEQRGKQEKKVSSAPPLSQASEERQS